MIDNVTMSNNGPSPLDHNVKLIQSKESHVFINDYDIVSDSPPAEGATENVKIIYHIPESNQLFSKELKFILYNDKNNSFVWLPQ